MYNFISTLLCEMWSSENWMEFITKFRGLKSEINEHHKRTL